MLNWLYTLADWLTPDRHRPEWRPARLELAPTGFRVARPKTAPVVVPWAAVRALTLSAVRRNGAWTGCLTVTYGPGRQVQPVLTSWGNFSAFATALAARLGERDPERWAEALERVASPDADVTFPLLASGLRMSDPPVLGRGV